MIKVFMKKADARFSKPPQPPQTAPKKTASVEPRANANPRLCRLPERFDSPPQTTDQQAGKDLRRPIQNATGKPVLLDGSSGKTFEDVTDARIGANQPVEAHL